MLPVSDYRSYVVLPLLKTSVFLVASYNSFLAEKNSLALLFFGRNF